MSLNDETARRPRRRRIMEEFVINEISAVDAPAQDGARMTIIKRREPLRTGAPRFTKAPTPAPRPAPQRTPPPPPPPREEVPMFEKLADDIRRRDGVSRCDAMRAARREHPAAFEAMQKRGGLSSAEEDEVTDELEDDEDNKRGAVTKFMRLVSEIKARDGCSRTQAMQKARREHPREFAAFQEV